MRKYVDDDDDKDVDYGTTDVDVLRTKNQNCC